MLPYRSAGDWLTVAGFIETAVKRTVEVILLTLRLFHRKMTSGHIMTVKLIAAQLGTSYVGDPCMASLTFTHAISSRGEPWTYRCVVADELEER
jgi:hypothetical protein